MGHQSRWCKVDYLKNSGVCDGMLLLLAERARQDARWHDSIREMIWEEISRTINPFLNIVEYIPITAKDKSKIHQVGETALTGRFFGCVVRAEGGWSGDFRVADYEDLQEPEVADIYVCLCPDRDSGDFSCVVFCCGFHRCSFVDISSYGG